MARVDAAGDKAYHREYAEETALLVDALKIDPANEWARLSLNAILRERVWNFPALELPHGQAVMQVACSKSGSLWVTLNGSTNTTVRWNVDTARIENVLFPVAPCETRALIFSPAESHVIIPRGSVTLLCDAVTLKPIRDIGPLPGFAAVQSMVSFSPNGLLVAHPSFVSASDRSVVWNIRDSATGELIRVSPPIPASEPASLAAFLDRTELRVLRGDGSLWEMPVSPVAAIESMPPAESARLLHAQFASDGKAALVTFDRGPLQPAEASIMAIEESDAPSLQPGAMAERFPWSKQPGLWSGLYRNAAQASFDIAGNALEVHFEGRITTASDIEAVAFQGDRIVTGDQNGTVIMHRQLPLPVRMQDASPDPRPISASALSSLDSLVMALTGIEFSEGKFVPVTAGTRLNAARAVQVDELQEALPGLDFQPVISAIINAPARPPGAAAFANLTDRLARAKMPEAPPPAVTAMEAAMSTGDDTAVLAAIRDAGPRGPVAAAALALALQSERAAWIQACLASAAELPALLQRLAVSRIARLDGRKADALAVWPDEFPDFALERLRHDWDGWEQADFKTVFGEMKMWVNQELGAIEVPKNATPEKRREVAGRLLDPATPAAIGRARFAIACLKAAVAFSAHKEEKETTFQLAAMARESGAPPEPCLRAEAMALTAMGDYQSAHPRWIELITEHPLATQEPGDYAEAAYTAFENADTQQAMQILTTGMHRFPRDGNFALRAGWVALLTGNSARAWQFLTTGQQIGFPPGKVENATALLVIAAALVGASDDAAVYFQELLEIDPAWGEASTLDTLEWPEELEAALRQYMR